MDACINEVVQNLEQNSGAYLAKLRRFLQQPSISSTGEGIAETAELLVKWIEDLGGVATIHPTPGYPVVIGEVNVGAPTTLLVYGMYDTMPVEGEVWSVPPFAGEVRDLSGIGPSIVARGVENSKGPLACVFNVIESFQRLEALPVNVKFVLEGEEELGSINLAPVVRAEANRLKADAVLFPNFCQDAHGKPILYLGMQGIAYMEVSVRGGEWGGPSDHAVHSSRANWYHSPTWTLVSALATMMDTAAGKVLIDGFYDNVCPPSSREREILAKLAETFSPEAFLDADAVAHFRYPADRIALLETLLYRPSLNICGLGAGDVGPGAKTILPHEAVARLDVRFGPNLDSDRIMGAIRRHLETHRYPQVKASLYSVTNWARVDPDCAPVRAMIEVYRHFGVEPEIWPTHPGGGPISLFTEEMGLPVVIGGMGHGGREHAPDEYASLEGIRLCHEAYARFFHAWQDDNP